MKFLYLTHNQNTRVREHLLKELINTTSLADMLRMARVCEGLSTLRRYLNNTWSLSRWLSKWMPYINVITRDPGQMGKAVEAIEVIANQSRKPGGNCSNCGTNHPPRKCKAYGKDCFHCHKKGHFSQLCRSKQCGRSPGPGVRTQNNNNRHSHPDVHEIDQRQFDDVVHFEQNLVTI